MASGEGWSVARERVKAAAAAVLRERDFYGLAYVDANKGGEGRPELVRDEEEWRDCFAMAASQATRDLDVDLVLEPQPKTFKITLPVGSGAGQTKKKKKIIYANPYPRRAVTMRVSCLDDQVEVREGKVDLEPGSRGDIVLKFAPLPTPEPRRATLLLQEEGSPFVFPIHLELVPVAGGGLPPVTPPPARKADP
eukprot:CAMPEP_0113683802 /NCGR_PEP_ID=MMETSP0038_2-20120614/13570_1 /TAXON_ID=2898 /ORGANISM="Cryptomonas paramecium" /LENGTH=193 /DNA_ID=CAMNT_0000603321 /DNA_START=58 /DNA_END=639 /DNA_ORIENTATION=+ /assembly_acc=CAM_ASM_000170